MGLYEMYVLATRADTAPDEEKAGTFSLCQGKASKSEAQEAIFTQPEGEFRFDGGYEEGRPVAI